MVDLKDEKGKYIEIGTSGIDISGGRFYEEYLDKLSHSESADIYDEMRRSDDQIAALLRSVKNPIKSARRFIQKADTDNNAEKIAEFIEYALFENMGTENCPRTFEKFITEALTCIDFGYSLFEVTNKVILESKNFGTYIGVKNLGWRSPKTIEEWDISTSGDLLRVRQSDSARGIDVWIPGQYMLHITTEMEGDNYEGISMLRPIYGNYIRKDFHRKMSMIGSERAAIGVPIAYIPAGQLNSGSQTAVENSLSRFVAHQKQFITAPEGWKIESLKIKFDADKLNTLLEREDKGMAKSFLAGFLELGMSKGGGGAFALGADLSDIFLSGIEVYANAITEAINIKLIPDLVKLNFGPQEKYPKLKIEGINEKAGKEFAEIIAMLSEKGLIQVTDKLREVVHNRYKLPEIMSDGVDVTTKKSLSSPTPIAQKLSENYNLAEPNISREIEVAGQKMIDLMSENMRPRAEKLVSKMMSIWKNSPTTKRMAEVNRLNVPGKNKYKKSISQMLADIYVKATAGVKRELAGSGLKLAEEPGFIDLPAESKAVAKSQAQLIIESQDADLKKNLFFSFTSNADKLPTEAQMEANLLRVVDKYLSGPSINTAGPNAVANAVNVARNAIYQKSEVLENIESFIFTNPSPKAQICIHLRNRVFSKEEYIVSPYLPPLHHKCNSYIRAQIAGMPGNKPVSPAGLTIQGNDAQIEQIQKSITL